MKSTTKPKHKRCSPETQRKASDRYYATANGKLKSQQYMTGYHADHKSDARYIEVRLRSQKKYQEKQKAIRHARKAYIKNTIEEDSS